MIRTTVFILFGLGIVPEEQCLQPSSFTTWIAGPNCRVAVCSDECAGCKIALSTFAAPPLVLAEPSIIQRPKESKYHSVVNEGDLVPRIDKEYTPPLTTKIIMPHKR
jgi:hypothetical protein